MGFCGVGLGHFVMCGSENVVVVVGKGKGGRGGLEREAASCVPGRSTRKLHRRDLQKS